MSKVLDTKATPHTCVVGVGGGGGCQWGGGGWWYQHCIVGGGELDWSLLGSCPEGRKNEEHLSSGEPKRCFQNIREWTTLRSQLTCVPREPGLCDAEFARSLRHFIRQFDIFVVRHFVASWANLLRNNTTRVIMTNRRQYHTGRSIKPKRQVLQTRVNTIWPVQSAMLFLKSRHTHTTSKYQTVKNGLISTNATSTIHKRKGGEPPIHHVIPSRDNVMPGQGGPAWRGKGRGGVLHQADFIALGPMFGLMHASAFCADESTVRQILEQTNDQWWLPLFQGNSGSGNPFQKTGESVTDPCRSFRRVSWVLGLLQYSCDGKGKGSMGSRSAHSTWWCLQPKATQTGHFSRLHVTCTDFFPTHNHANKTHFGVFTFSATAMFFQSRLLHKKRWLIGPSLFLIKRTCWKISQKFYLTL